jgi:hypothetical protein
VVISIPSLVETKDQNSIEHSHFLDPLIFSNDMLQGNCSLEFRHDQQAKEHHCIEPVHVLDQLTIEDNELQVTCSSEYQRRSQATVQIAIEHLCERMISSISSQRQVLVL